MTQTEKNLINAVLASVTDGVFSSCENPEALVKLAKYHSVENLVAEVLSKSSILPAEVSKELTEMQSLLIVKDANQELEVNNLINLFEENRISVIMLKGWLMKNLYPRTDMRSMADTDIFIKESDQQTVHNIIKNQGYSVVSYGGKKDNVYVKKPFSTLEMHKNLFMYEDNWNEIFNNENSETFIWKRVKKISGYEHIYQMDDELFFVYMIAHIAKHLLDDGGIGIRAMLDVWLFMKKTPNLNLDIVYKDLKKLNLCSFSDKVIELTEYWFDKKISASNTIEEFSDYILKCGVYGNSNNFVATKEELICFEKPSKIKYVFRRAFPKIEDMKVRYPQLNKNIWLLPVLYIKRLWYSLIHRTDSIKKEINSAGEVDFTEVKRIHQLYKDIGLR